MVCACVCLCGLCVMRVDLKFACVVAWYAFVCLRVYACVWRVFASLVAFRCLCVFLRGLLFVVVWCGCLYVCLCVFVRELHSCCVCLFVICCIMLYVGACCCCVCVWLCVRFG